MRIMHHLIIASLCFFYNFLSNRLVNHISAILQQFYGIIRKNVNLLLFWAYKFKKLVIFFGTKSYNHTDVLWEIQIQSKTKNNEKKN